MLRRTRVTIVAGEKQNY